MKFVTKLLNSYFSKAEKKSIGQFEITTNLGEHLEEKSFGHYEITTNLGALENPSGQFEITINLGGGARQKTHSPRKDSKQICGRRFRGCAGYDWTSCGHLSLY